MRTYNFVSSPSLTKNNQYDQRISLIEKKLNYLCCQHDSLMPVLQIYDSSSHVHRWQNSLKLINRKLNQCQNSLQQIIQKKNCQVDLKNVENKKKMDDLKLNIKDLDKGLSLIKQKHKRQQNEEIKNNGQVQINELIEQIERYTQISLASFSNENEKEIDKDKLKKIIKNVFVDIDNEYDQFKQQIQVLKSSMPKIDLQKFHNFTFQRLGCDLVQINEGIQLIFGTIQQSQCLTNDQKQKIQLLKTRYKFVNWQINGMKKKYISELSIKYEEEQDKYQVNKLQKSLLNDIKQLESSYDIIGQKLQYLDKTKR